VLRRREVMRTPQRGPSLFAKRVFDRAVALTVGVVAAPLLASAALACRATMGSPVFFRQTRPGLRGKPFQIYKLRTMTDARDARGQLLPDAERLTALGRFMRATSIDELPQLWNVVRGELSLVGPRPLLMEYLPLYSPEQARRHDVLPGITGWAQIHGRNALSWEEKFALDVWYVDNWSLALDLRILAQTALTVLRRDGISREGHASMPNFQGSASASDGRADAPLCTPRRSEEV
jgi:lipopolysaccharide/colanic/teichoic acid biosynthesis glycosyltransferase